MARKPETSFRVNKIRPFLNTRFQGTMFFPIQQKAIRGDPDYLLCMKGIFVGMEVKDTLGEPDPLQLAKLEKIKEAGGIAFIVRPQTWEIAKKLLLQLDQGSIDGTIKIRNDFELGFKPRKER